jgi:transposase
MRQKSNSTAAPSEKLVRDIRRATRKQYSAEQKIRIVLDGPRGETPIGELCRREGIAESMYYSGRRSSLRLASVGLLATPHGPPRRTRSSSLGARRRT